MGYSMYAWAGNGAMTRNVQIGSIANNQNEINEQTTPAPGVILTLETIFNAAKRPAPFSFIWKPQKEIPSSMFRLLFDNGEFALELRIVEPSSGAGGEFNFYRCKLLRRHPISNGNLKIDATYMSFQ